jgi:hypothetical protein
MCATAALGDGATLLGTMGDAYARRHTSEKVNTACNPRLAESFSFEKMERAQFEHTHGLQNRLRNCWIVSPGFKNLFALTKRFMCLSRDRLRMLATASVEHRIDWALAYLAERAGCPRGDGVLMQNPRFRERYHRFGSDYYLHSKPRTQRL